HQLPIAFQRGSADNPRRRLDLAAPYGLSAYELLDLFNKSVRVDVDSRRLHLFRASIIRSRVIGRSRILKSSARATALAIAAPTGPWAASPTPSGGSLGWEISSMLISGTSSKPRIG